jgi:hypothetical protein
MNQLTLCMRMAIVACGIAMPAIAQLAAAQGTIGMGGAAAQPRQPYTAEFKITRVQMLANGTTITNETKEVEARDSQGRTMRATTRTLPSSDRITSTFVDIHDPEAHTQINWTSQEKRAHVIKMPSPDEMHGCWSTSEGNMTVGYGGARRAAIPPAPGGGTGSSGAAGTGAGTAGGFVLGSSTTFSVQGGGASGAVASSHSAPVRPLREDLGTDSIMGVEVRGNRTTFTTPAGQIGNSEPLVRISETWMAPSLGIALRQVSDDPQSGKMTRELVGIYLNEPDPSTFQPPEGYEVVTQEMHPVPCQQAP